MVTSKGAQGAHSLTKQTEKHLAHHEVCVKCRGRAMVSILTALEKLLGAVIRIQQCLGSTQTN